MIKRIALSTVAVYVAWSVLDFVIHGIMLGPTYEATADLWRPEAEMKMGLLQVVNIIAALMFSLIFHRLAGEQSVKRGVEFGLYYGVAVGVGMGYGTYAFQAIPHKLALGWFLGMIVEAVVAGALVGLIASRCAPKAASDADTPGTTN
jgi:hypothetical protein